MKKILKIITLALLAVACLITAVACSPDDDGSGEKGLLCKDIGGVYTVYKYVDDGSKEKVLDIGAELGNDVFDVKIKKDAFSGNDTIEEIIVPASVTAIDEGAFAGMKSLKKITLPFVGASADAVENARTLGYLFGTSEYDGGSLINTTYKKDSTEKRYMPSTLRTVVINATDGYKVPMYAFSGCVNLTTIQLVGGITEIGEYAFSGCINLSSTNVPETVSVICKGAYNGCSALSVDLINNATTLTQIGESAFEGAKLENVVLAENVKIGNKAFYNSTVKTVALKGAVEIKASAFANCVKLTAVTLDNVSNGIIEQFAFQGAIKLNQVGATEGAIDIKGFSTVENLAFADIFEDSTKINVLSNGLDHNLIFGW
ncbi:MAG: leucine-rich repeat domain-containing protein [Clostridia bacterium]|nr:leucine-rich repeat domain-containing protein [Clostridia bacterium]